MLHLAPFSTRQPFLSIAIWHAVVTALAVIGLGVSNSLSPTTVVVPGSETTTPHSATDHPSAAFTTSEGRTADVDGGLSSRQHERPAQAGLLLVEGAAGSGVCATRGQPDLRGLATAGPGLVSELVV